MKVGFSGMGKREVSNRGEIVGIGWLFKLWGTFWGGDVGLWRGGGGRMKWSGITTNHYPWLLARSPLKPSTWGKFKYVQLPFGTVAHLGDYLSYSVFKLCTLLLYYL